MSIDKPTLDVVRRIYNPSAGTGESSWLLITNDGRCWKEIQAGTEQPATAITYGRTDGEKVWPK